MSKAAEPENRRARRLPEPKARGRQPLRCVHHLFEAQASRTPAAVAVACAGRSVTYGELNARANRLARRLRASGVGPESLVGLCVGRSEAMVVGLLGALKAGAAYVPIDPTYPRERIAYLLEDSRVSVLLTEERLLEGLAPLPPTVVALDRDWESIARESDQDPAGWATLDNLAYVIYTSGSTGRPKGAMISHRGLANYLAWCTRAYAVGEGQGAPVHSSISFDLTVTALLAPLAVGRRVDLLDDDLGVEQLGEALREPRDYSLIKITPAHLQWLGAQTAPAEAAGRTRAFVIGGEQLTAEHVAFWRARAPETALINEYGPTETVVGCCVYRVPTEGPISGPIPIGRPIANTRLYVLDRNLEPVPVGVAGELFIGGLGVARGYLRRPRLTAEKFIPDPFGGSPGARLYRTGDRARWRPDGNLEYLGRVDRQVKVRGHRVEPGEVEAALAGHPAVREAAVVARGDASGDVRLVAYLSFEPEHSAPTASDLRRFLAATLPEPMIPSAYVALDALPLTPNGKVDREALPAPEGGPLEPSVAYVAPRGTAEELIAGVWTAVLGSGRVGALDDFFELGGHSLLATQIMSRLRDGFGIEIPLRALFESPTVAGLAEHIESIRLRGARRDAAPIERSERVGPQPLSFAQEALWLLHQLAPDRPTFNVTAALRVAGPLDVPALERAVAELVRRHESLRTTFTTIDGRPVQVVADHLELPLRLADLTRLPARDREAETRRWAVEESRRPFDLARGPLALISVLKLDAADHAVLLAMHHVMTDGWSFGVAARELGELYQSFRDGLPSSLPELAIQYGDFARWQRVQREGAAWATQIDHWRRRLAGVPALEFPADRPRPPVRSMRGALLPFDLSPELSEAVRATCRREGVTPFMLLLGAFQALLSRWAGQDDFAVGSPVANRTRSETEGLIGYFVNMVAIRADLSGDPTAREFLARVRETSLDAFEHQEIPLEVLIEELNPRREASRTPLFQVMFVLQNNALPEVSGLGLHLSALDVHEGTGTAKFELALGFEDAPGGFSGAIEYSTDLFDGPTIEAFSRQYATLLGSMIADPGRRLSEWSLLSDAERRQFAGEGIEAPPLVPGALGIHEAFEAQVRATPSALALIAGAERLTYAALNERANRLAHFLRARGVGPEARVALLLEHPVKRLTAVLGVLKAGAAYVPLEPTTPRERLRWMLVDAGASVVVAEAATRGKAPESSSPFVDLDAEVEPIAAQSSTNPSIRVHPGNLAYVVFTSGSTGRPKGVMVPHAGLLNAASAWERAYALCAEPPLRHLQAAGFGFDVFAGDWVRALSTGGALVSCPRAALLDPAALLDLIRRERVGAAELVPAAAALLAEEAERSGGVLPLRLLAVGSDALPSSLLARLRRLSGPSCRVVNSYGLTEATVDSAYYDGPAGEGDLRDAPVGLPFGGVRAYVLDGGLRPSPSGVPGELYVGGAGVARGYSGDARRTASRFVPDPFGPAGSRLYRTGDRARRRAGDGALELLGRVDRQVKVRGHRVEPGEVEAALARHDAVREAVVVAADRGADGVRLVAYVVAKRGQSVSPDALRRFLRDRLPRPMIPSRIVPLEALPRTPSGKVDHEALPSSSFEPSADEGLVAPRDEVEAKLAAIWEDLLDVRPVGVTDDFFDLGAHSLLAVRLAARIEETFGRAVPLASLFVGTTIEALAERLREPAEARARSPLVDLGASGPGTPLVLVHPVGGGILCYNALVRRLDGTRPVFGLQSVGIDGDDEPDRDLERMAARYVAALREARPDGPYLLAGWSLGGVVAFEMARQLTDQGHDIASLILIDSAAPSRRRLKPPDEMETLTAFATDLARTSGRDPAPYLAQLRGLGSKAIGDGGFGESPLGAELASEFGPGRLRRLYDVFQANRQALADYVPRPYQGRVVQIRAEASERPSWSKLAAPGGLISHDLSGDHYSILQRPDVERLAEILAGELELHRPEGRSGALL